MGEVSENLFLPVPPVGKIPPGSNEDVLAIPPDDVDRTIQEVLLQLPLSESLAGADSVFPTSSPSQLPASPPNPPAISELPAQGGKDGLLPGSPIDVHASTSEIGAKPSSPTSETF